MLYNIPSDVNPIIGGWVDVNAIVRIFLSIKFFRTDPNVHCSYTLNVRNYEKISSYTRTSRVEKSVERELTFLYFLPANRCCTACSLVDLCFCIGFSSFSHNFDEKMTQKHVNKAGSHQNSGLT